MVSGLALSTPGLGTWRFSGYGWTTRVSVEEATRVVSFALDNGISWFDTAPSYGNGRAEAILGRALPPDVPVVTKVAPASAEPMSRSQVRRSFAGSIRRLGASRPLIVLMHFPCRSLHATLAAWRSIGELVDEGWAVAAGMSNVDSTTVAAAHEVHPVRFVQNQGSVISWDGQTVDTALGIRRLGGRFMTYGVLAFGLLRDQDMGTRSYAERDWRSGHLGVPYFDTLFSPEALERHRTRLRWLQAAAAGAGLSVATAAVRWAVRNEHIDHVVLGARNAGQLGELLDAVRTGDELALCDPHPAGIAEDRRGDSE